LITCRTEITIGPIIPIKKYSIFTTSEPVSSLLKMKVKKYMKVGFANIIKRKSIQALSTFTSNIFIPMIAKKDGIA
jgi:hypothetical protein